MKVTLYQTRPVLLDLKANLEDVIEKIRKGAEQGSDLIAFPELALTGYFVGRRYHEVSLRMDAPEIRRIVDATKGTAAIIGFIEESPSMNFYNAALVAVNGELLFAYRKLNLPNYGVFEERKLFAPGKKVPVFKLHGFTVGVFICNDMWHPSIPYLGVCCKADIFVTIFNSCQGSMGTEFSNIESWEIIDKFYSRVFGVYNLCVNRVGEESILEEPESLPSQESDLRHSYSFWGGSEIINPFGQQVQKAAYHEEDEITAFIFRDLLRKKRILLPYLRNDDPYFTHRELQRILYKPKAAGIGDPSDD